MRGPAPSSLRVRSLALCVSLALTALGSGATAAPSIGHPAAAAAAALFDMPIHATAQNRVVKNCNDSGTDSLRDVITNQAQPGDTVDLSELPVRCGMTPSVITLGSEIVIAQGDLTIQGRAAGSVTVSGAGMSRVFHHTGTGTFSLNALTVSDGYYHIGYFAYGGCIQSDTGNLFFNHIIVSGCSVVSDDHWANGGGISAAQGDVTLIASTISNNRARGGDGSLSWGGGVYSGGTTIALYSSISGNTSHSSPSNHYYDYGFGGGIAAMSGTTLFGCTVDGNEAVRGGGVYARLGSSIVENTTISGNAATASGGGLLTRSADSLTIANSTIAFNRSVAANGEGGISFRGLTNGLLTLQSSIFANNTAGAAIPSDVYLTPGFGTLAGADNLVIAANVFNPVVITVTLDPMLGPLQLNGGHSKTHMLMAGSPALAKGNVNALSPPWNTTDQRGIGYPRTTGPNGSIDLGAVQFDAIFVDNFDLFY